MRHCTKGGTRLGVLAALLVSHALLWPISPARGEELFDADIRTAMLKQKSGPIAHVESVYNDIFVARNQGVLSLTFQWKGWHFQESQINLTDPDDLPMLYARTATIAAIYPQDLKRVLVIGLGGGAIPTYLGRFLPDATIDTVELDPGVIDVAKKYFGVRETSKSRIFESDGRVFLNRHTEPYDLIIVDAFTGSYIPFHLMTKEFYQLVRNRLAPHGVAAFNILPGTKLYDSNVRTLKTVFDHIDLYHSGGDDAVLVMAPNDLAPNDLAPNDLAPNDLAPSDPIVDNELLRQKAVAAQERYKFRFDVAKLAVDWRIETPKELKGDLLTDDFAPANVYGTDGRRYRRK